MDAIDAYLVARCLLLADALERLDEAPRCQAAEVARDAAAMLELLAEALDCAEQAGLRSEERP